MNQVLGCYSLLYSFHQ
uniref:Uncharacterized protein n=1 Tax=Arundo donax TaxID=35708 RepID=A0A0A9BQW7_ARUDO